VSLRMQAPAIVPAMSGPEKRAHSPTPAPPLRRQRSGGGRELLGRALNACGMLTRANSSSSMKPVSAPVTEGDLDGLALTLASMAASAHLSDQLVHLGFAVPLVKMCGTNGTSETVRLLSLRALAHLASRREHVKVIREAGAVAVILEILENGPPSLVLGALEVLRPLSRDSSTKDELRESTAVKLLVALLGPACTPSASACSDSAIASPAAVAAAALGVLKHLSASASGQEALRAAGAIKPLVGVLETLPAAEEPALVARAATTLSNLAIDHQPNKASMRHPRPRVPPRPRPRPRGARGGHRGPRQPRREEQREQGRDPRGGRREGPRGAL